MQILLLMMMLSLMRTIQVENGTMHRDMRMMKTKSGMKDILLSQEDMYCKQEDCHSETTFINKMKVEDFLYTAITELAEYHDLEIMEEDLMKPSTGA